MVDSSVDDFLGNSPKPIAQVASADVASNFLGNEPGIGEQSGLDQRLAEHDELQSKYGTAGQQLLTGIEGTAQGFAGSVATGAEALLSKAGVAGLSPEEQELRAKANPITRYGTEGLGFGIGAFTGTGEAALLSRIGKAAEVASGLGEASKITRFATSTGSELAAMQAGNEISKAINQDPNQTLGSAAINIGLSGIMGAAGGAALGSIGPMWKSFTKGAAEDAGVGAAVIQDGEDHLTRSIMKPKEKETFLAGLRKQKANANEIKEAGNLIGAPASASQTSASDYVQSMDSALSQSPTIAGVQRQQEIARGFDKVGQVIDRSFPDAETELSPFQRGQTIKDQIQNAVDDIYAPLKEQYANRAAYGEHIALPDAARLKQYDSLIELSQKFEKASPETAGVVRGAAEGLLRQDTVNDLDEYLKILGQKQRAARIAQDHYTANALGNTIESLNDFSVGQIAKAGKSLQSEGAEHAEAIASDIVNEHKALKAKYAEFKNILGDLASDSKLGKRATTAGGIEDVLESIPNEKLVDKMFDPKNSAGLSRLQEKFPDVFRTVVNGKKADLLASAKDNPKSLLDNLYGVGRNGSPKMSPEIRDLMFSQEEQKFLKASHTWIESLPKNVGPSGTPKGMAFMAALTQHPLRTIVSNARDIGIKTLLKFATPAEIEANRVSMDYINNAVKGDKLLDKATKALFQTGEVVPQHLLPDEKSRKRLDDHLGKINENTEVASTVGGGINHHLPDHAVAAGTLAANAVNYFNSIRPTESKSFPLDVGSPKSKMKDAQYNRALDIAEQPLLILQHAKNGTLQSQDIKTIQAIYPGLHSQMVSNINEQLVNSVANKTPIPYQQRRALSMIMGSNLDSSMGLSGAQSIMQSNASQQISPENQHGGGRQKTSGAQLSQINKTNQLYLTNSQRMAVHKTK